MERARLKSKWLKFAGLALVACACLPPAAGAAASPDAGRIVAQAGGQSLTQRDIDELLILYDWLLESPLNSAERSSMTVILVREFNADPAKAARNYAALDKTLPQILSLSLTHQARRRSEVLKGIAQQRRTDAYMAEILTLLARHPSVLAVADDGVLTQHQVDAMIACDDNVAQTAGLPKASPAERARVTRAVAQAFPGLKPTSDAYEAITDAEERCFSLRDFVENSAKNHDAVIADIRAEVHSAKDAPAMARKLENNALLVSRMQTFAQQQKIISGVISVYQGQLNALRAASDSFTWHESRAYAHGESKPGGPSGFGPN